MRVPEALEALDSVRRLDPLDDKWRAEVTRILDSVWLEAYEEGLERVFEPPQETGADHYFRERAEGSPEYSKALTEARHKILGANPHIGKHARPEASQ